MITWMKIKTMAPIGAVVAVAAGVPIIGLQKQNSALKAENEKLQADAAARSDDDAQRTDLERLKQQLEALPGLRERAEEVHKLRARVAQMSRERKAVDARLEALQARMARRNKEAAVAGASSAVGEENDPAAQERIEIMSGLKDFALALIMYADSNNGDFPESLEDLDPRYLGDAFRAVRLDDVVMIDYGNLSSMENPAESVVFSTREPVGHREDGTPLWAYAFGDGHSEITDLELGEDGKLIRE